MSHDAINSWVERAKEAAHHAGAAPRESGVTVVTRQDAQLRGSLIMDIAEKIRPLIANFFKDARDENGMLVQPARVRAIALNVAQGIVNDQQAA